MVLSTETERFLEQLDRLSKNSLVRRNEIGVLLELSRSQNKKVLLSELAFRAKICWNTFSLMKRLEPGAEGYERLLSEFQVNTEKSLALFSTLLEGSPNDIRAQFNKKYFTNTPGSLQARIELFHDMSWIKNWTIDHHTDVPL